MLLMTPVFSPQTPVRMAVHDGLLMVVCPTMLAGAVVPPCINSKKWALAGSASTRLRLVPSTPITSTLGVVSATVETDCGAAALVGLSVLRSNSSRTAARATITDVELSGDTGSCNDRSALVSLAMGSADSAATLTVGCCVPACAVTAAVTDGAAAVLAGTAAATRGTLTRGAGWSALPPVSWSSLSFSGLSAAAGFCTFFSGLSALSLSALSECLLGFGLAGLRCFFAGASDGAPTGCDDAVDPAAPAVVSAHAGQSLHPASAVPIPSATASPPTRPMHLPAVIRNV